MDIDLETIISGGMEGQYKPKEQEDVESKQNGVDDHTKYLTKEAKYECAAIYMDQGEHHLSFEHHPTNPPKMRAYRAVNGPLVNRIDWFAGFVLLVLAIFENPAVYQLPVTVCAVIEIAMLLCLLIHSLFYYRWKGFEGLKEKKMMLKHVLILEMLVEALVVLSGQHHHLRIMRAFRPLLLLGGSCTKDIKRVMEELQKSLVPILDALIILFVFVTTFAVLGFHLFSEESHTDEYTGDLTNWYFEDFAGSWINLFILTTTANHPDVMMPASKKRSWAPIFFMIFILIGNYFIGSLLLAVVYNSFKENRRKNFRKHYKYSRHGLRQAFKVAVHQMQGTMDFETFRGIMQAYHRIEEIRPACRRQREYQAVIGMFYALQEIEPCSQSGRDRDCLTLDQWLNLPRVSCCSWTLKQRNEDFRPELFFGTKRYPTRLEPFLRRLRIFVKSELLEHFISFVIVINACFIIAETVIRTKKNINDHLLDGYEEAFLAFYTLEVALKITSFGPRFYLRSGFNKFDLLIVVVGLIGQTAKEEFAFIATLKLFRLLRVLVLKDNFFFTLYAVFEMLPKMRRFLLTFVWLYFFFAIIGMQSFSGLLSKCGCVTRNDTGSVQCQPELFQNQSAYTFVVNSSNKDECDPSKQNCTILPCDSVPNCSVLRCGRFYGSYYDRSTADGLYYLNNFDNLLRSYVTLFELMVVNNWHMTMQGTVDAIRHFKPSGLEQLASAYFITFYLLTVIVVLHITTSSIITIFETLLPSLRKRKKSKQKKYSRLSNLLKWFPWEKTMKLFTCNKKKTKSKEKRKESVGSPGATKIPPVKIEKNEFHSLMSKCGFSKCGFSVETKMPDERLTEDDADDSSYVLEASRPNSPFSIYKEIFQGEFHKWDAKVEREANDCSFSYV